MFKIIMDQSCSKYYFFEADMETNFSLIALMSIYLLLAYAVISWLYFFPFL